MSAKLPQHEKAYRGLRDMILFGELAPGQAVTIQGLVAELGMGMTPVREAIRRLTSHGALVFQGNRRVSVPVLGPQEWDEIAFVRLAVEPKLALLAVDNINEKVIANLKKIDDDLNGAIAKGDVRGYLESNTLFHQVLYACSRAEVLISIADMLWLRGGPSLRVVLGRYGTANLPDKHAEALAAMRARDGEALAAAITADILQGVDQVRLGFSQELD
ncbi:MAG: GntR family transcriptional regulator [Rhodobacteraceae bacterium]|nr:GntR family transcriptional regulator [Paracoccaceae bacterium]